jgi:hypothetical protein
MSTPEETITADDLRQMARVLGLVPIPEHLMERVLKSVRTHRAAMRRFDESGIALGQVLTAQVYRV